MSFTNIDGTTEHQATAHADKTVSQTELLYNRLVKRSKHLRKWARRIETDAYRLYDRDIPEIPLVLDLYGDAVSGALYKRPYEKDKAEEALWLDAMKGAVSRALNIREDHIFIKMRQRQLGNSQYSRLRNSNIWKDVHEGRLKFRVNLSDYLDTGLFLDSRKKRALLLAAAKGKRVLNLFSYTSTLSIAAAAGGALATDSVDMSNTYLEWGNVNFSLNGFTAHLTDGRDYFRNGRSAKTEPHRLINADVLAFLDQAVRAKAAWDLIILDPPSFSNSKKMKADLDIRRDYKALIRQCLAILSPGGSIWFSSNARGFKADDWDNPQFPKLEIKNMDEELRDEDFKEKKIPFCRIIYPK
jgi:23S rRNA G2069 N7-methylase RlmK/C1962 C5-methylase RlmI